MKFSIDLVIILVFLVVTLIVGLGYGKSVKSIRDYALGGRNFSTEVLISTIVATWVSGSMFFTTLQKTYSGGIEYLISLSGFVFSFFVLGFIFIPKMEIFLGKTSFAEALGDIYGKKVRIIAAVLGAVGSSGKIAVQFSVFGNLISYFLEIPNYIAIITTGIIATTYSAFGGIRSVTFTDLIQFVTFGFVIPLIGIIIWSYANVGDFVVAEAFAVAKFDISKVLSFDNPNILSVIALFLYFATPSMKPYWFQRVSMGSSIRQVKKAFLISGCILFFIILSMAWIPFLLFNVNPDLDKAELLGFIADNYTYPGLKGLLLIAVAAMTMSTADSNINASAVLFSNDICKPLGIGKGKDLVLSKIFAVILGILAILSAFLTKDLLSMILLANSFYMPVITPILFLTILGFRTSKKSILIGMSSGFLFAIVWQMLQIKITGGVHVIGVIVNIAFCLGSHYILKQEGGWPKTEDKKYLRLKKSFFDIKIFKNFFPNHHNNYSYFGFGVYCIICSITTIYSTKIELLKDHNQIILIIYQFMMIIAISLASYPIWPDVISKKLKEIMVYYLWYAGIFFILILFGSFFVIVSDFNQLPFTIFTTNIIIAVILAGWKLALLMIIIGFYLCYELYKYYSVEVLDFSIGSPQFIFMYTLVLIGTVVAIFFKPRQEQYELTEQKLDYLEFYNIVKKKELSKALELKNEFLRNLQHETHTPITGITSLGQALYDSYDKLSKKQVKKYLRDIANSSTRLNSYISNITDLSKLSSMNYDFKKELFDFSELVAERLELCRKLYVDDQNDKQEFVIKIENDVSGYFDKYYIAQSIDNMIINAIKYCKEGKIEIKLEQTKTYIKFSVKDEGIGVPKEELYDIFDPFTVSSRTKTSAEGRGVGLALCKRIIELNGGTIFAKQNKDKGTIFVFKLPKK